MVKGWRYAAVAIVFLVATVSGWVYPFLRPAASEEVPSAAVAQGLAEPPVTYRHRIWHGRVTQVLEVPGGIDGPDRKFLVEYPAFNVHQQREYSHAMWFWVSPDAVTDRRTGQSGTLAVGQRVTFGYSGIVLFSDPPQCHADFVMIEPENPLPTQP